METNTTHYTGEETASASAEQSDAGSLHSARTDNDTQTSGTQSEPSPAMSSRAKQSGDDTPANLISEGIAGQARNDNTQGRNDEKSTRKNPKTALLIILPVLVVAAAAALILIFNPFGWGEGEKGGDTRITLSQYNEIERGMSYEKVTELLGSEGVLQSEAGDPDSASYLTVYRWEGLNEDSQAIVVFSGGMVASKTHIGLSDE